MPRFATLIAASVLALISAGHQAKAETASPAGLLQQVGYDDPYPRGSFELTCRNIRVDGRWLHARCRTIDGDWVRSSIEFTNCRRNAVANHDGRLVCGPR
jgi:hypothetical protein